MGNFIDGAGYRWPRGVIPYEVKSSGFSTSQQMYIQNAISAWNATNIELRPRNARDRHFVRFIKSTSAACSSAVGRRVNLMVTPSYQLIRCNPQKPEHERTVIHEIGHAVGLWHEHQRADRAAFVRVVEENVIREYRHNFRRRITDGLAIGPYDYDSVMHYGKNYFRTNWVTNVRIRGEQSSAAVGMAGFKNELHLIRVGRNKELVHVWSKNGIDWTREGTIGQKSKAAPALATFGGKLHLLYLRGSSNSVCHSWSSDGRSWTHNGSIPGRKSREPPALVALNNKLHMLHLGNSDNDIRYSYTNDGISWTRTRRIGQQSKASPAIAAFQNLLHLVHIGNSSNDIWYSTSADGQTWAQNEKIGQQSKASPFLASYGQELHLVHLGSSANTIWHSKLDGQTWKQDWQVNMSSRTEPRLVALGNPAQSFFLIHGGDSTNRLYQSRYDPNMKTIETSAAIGTQPGLSPEDITAVNAIYR